MFAQFLPTSFVHNSTAYGLKLPFITLEQNGNNFKKNVTNVNCVYFDNDACVYFDNEIHKMCVRFILNG